MGLVRQFKAIFVIVALTLAGSAFAAPEDAIFNKEGVWAIDVDHGACALSRKLDRGDTFLFRAEDGQVTFGFFPKVALQAGQTGRIEADTDGFDFKPGYVRGGVTLFSADNFSAEAVAALRRAGEVRVLIDGQPVVTMRLEGTGFASALDAVIACSQGVSGWWGKGATPPA